MSQAYLLLRLALESLGPFGDYGSAVLIKQAMEDIWSKLTPEERSALTCITQPPPGMSGGV